MKVLHLASQYPSSSVYKELFNHISKQRDIYQYVFCGNRKDSIKNRFIIDNDKIKFINKITHSKISRILYYPRIIKVKRAVENSVDMNSIDIIHAHTLIGDGGTALLLKKKYNIDFVVSVRSTDINGYLKKLPHSRLILKQIIENAKKIIFISPNAVEDIKKHLNKKIILELEKKTVIIPNGINDYWLSNISKHRNTKLDSIRFLQVSEFLPRKNIDFSIRIISELIKRGIKCNLDIVGDGVEKEKITTYINDNNLSDSVNLLGKINNNEEMQKIYQNHDIFIMPSSGETFGLVYIEALSQSLPIIYSVGTGVYGFFKEGTVGYGVIVGDVEDSINKIKKIIKNYDIISKRCSEEVCSFDWNKISNKILKIYEE